MKMKLDTLRDAFVNSTSLNTITGNETLGIDNESFLQNKPDVQLQEKLWQICTKLILAFSPCNKNTKINDLWKFLGSFFLNLYLQKLKLKFLTVAFVIITLH